jgi:hypothetical protein
MAMESMKICHRQRMIRKIGILLIAVLFMAKWTLGAFPLESSESNPIFLSTQITAHHHPCDHNVVDVIYCAEDNEDNEQDSEDEALFESSYSFTSASIDVQSIKYLPFGARQRLSRSLFLLHRNFRN